MIQEPIQPTYTPTPEHTAVARPRRSSAVRIAVVIGLVLLLAVPVVMAMAANAGPTSPTDLLAAGATNAPSTDAPATADPNSGLKGFPGLKGFGGFGGFGGGRGFGGGDRGPGKGPITITSISGNDLALGTQDGWKRTITVTSTTTITKAGQPITATDLKVGDEVTFKQTKNADGTYTITAITVATPTAGGEVTAVGDTTITVKQRGGTTKVITVNGSTVYKLGATTGSKSDVTVGGSVEAAGTVSGDTFTAITVNVRLAQAGGEVTKVDGNAVTVKKHDGSTQVITVTGSTTYKLGSADATKADVKVGTDIDASGKTSGDTFTAVTVRIHPAVSGGEVTAKGSDSITVKGRDGKLTVIHVTEFHDLQDEGCRHRVPDRYRHRRPGHGRGQPAHRRVAGRHSRPGRAQEGHHGSQDFVAATSTPFGPSGRQWASGTPSAPKRGGTSDPNGAPDAHVGFVGRRPDPGTATIGTWFGTTSHRHTSVAGTSRSSWSARTCG